MWDRLTKPFAEFSPEVEDRIRLLAGFTLILLGVGIGSGLIFILASGESQRFEAFIGSLLTIIFLIIPYFFSRSRFYWFAAIYLVVVMNWLAYATYENTGNLVALSTLIIPVFLVGLLAPLPLAIGVAVVNLSLVLLLPHWLFGISFQQASLQALTAISWLVGLVLFVAIDYRRLVEERRKALAETAATLRESQTQLEARVVERTEELNAANELLVKEIEERKIIEAELSEREKQLRELTQQVVLTQEEERRHMSRELHDEAGQALTALRFHLALIRDQVRMNRGEGNQSDDLPAMLDDAVTRVDTVMARIRALAHGLRPAALDDLGLHPALEGLCTDFAKQTRMNITYEGLPPPPLSDAAEICLYRFLQETLTNVVKHAEATRVQVRLAFDDQEVFLSVTDDGQGFDSSFIHSKTSIIRAGIGLLGIQERLEAESGRLEVYTQPGQGTHLTARVPRLAAIPEAPGVVEMPEIMHTGIIRVVIAEDHHVVRALISEWLEREEDIHVVGEVEDGADLLPTVEELLPDVLMLDVHMPNQRATEAVIAIRARFPQVRILIFSAYDRPEYVVNLITAGVMGYALKDDSPAKVLEAIRSVAAGQTWLTPRVAQTLQQANGNRDSSPLAELTPREMEVLQLMVDGISNEDMAETLVLSIQTVRNHASSVYRKLGVNSRVDAVLAALRHGMTPSPHMGDDYTQSPGSGG